jgi:hypothetical protein
MSALGHKQTCAPQKIMSALHPKADMCGALANVCYVPKADMSRFIRSPRLLHIRSESQCLAAEKRETDFEMNSI